MKFIILIVLIVIFQVELFSSNLKDSLYSRLTTETVDSVRAEILEEILYELAEKMFGNYIPENNGRLTIFNSNVLSQDDSVYYEFKYIVEELKRIRRRENNPDNLIRIINMEASMHINKQNFLQALYLYKPVLNIIKNASEEKRMIVYNNVAHIYGKIGEYDQQVFYMEEALKISTKNADTSAILLHYDNIGQAYRSFGNLNLSDSISTCLLKMARNIKDSLWIVRGLNQWAITKRKLSQYDQAEKLYNNALQIAKQTKYLSSIIEIYGNLSVFYKYKQDYPKSIKYIDSALALIPNSKIESKFQLLINKAFVLASDNKTALALNLNKQLEQSIDSFSGNQNHLISIYTNYQKIYEITKDYKKALIYSQKINLINDSILKVKEKARFSNLIIDYEVAKKQAEDDLLKIELTENIRKTNNIKYMFVFIMVMIILVGLWLYSRYRNKLKISEKNKFIERQKGVIEGQEAEKKRYALELHDGIGSELSALKMQMSATNDKSLIEYQNKLSQICSDVRKLSHNLYSPALYESSLLSALESIIAKHRQSTSIRFDLNIFPEEEVDSIDIEHKHHIYRIVQEALLNAVKYSNATHINIGILCNNKLLSLCIEDNGIGFDVKASKEGIGLKNIKDRVKTMNGKLTLDSIMDKGTTYLIEFKV